MSLNHRRARSGGTLPVGRKGLPLDLVLRQLTEIDGLEAELRVIAEAIRLATGARRLAIYVLVEREGNGARQPRPLVVLGGVPDAPPPAEDFVGQMFSQWQKRKSYAPATEGSLRVFPIRYCANCAGALALDLGGETTFYPEESGDLSSLLSLAAMTIAKHWLQAEGHRRLAELKALHGLGQATSSSLSVEDILDDVFTTAAEIIEYDTASLFIVDKEERCLRLIASRNIPPGVAQNARFPIGEGVVGWVVVQERPLAVPDTRRDPRFVLGPGLGRKHAHSLLVVPLRMRGEVIAALSFSRHKVNGFTPHDLELAEVVAAYAAQALEHSRLSRSIAEAESLRQGTELLTSLAHDVRAPLNLIRYVVEILREEFPNADSGQMDLFDKVAVASRQLSQLVNAVLESSRLESSLLDLSPEPILLADLAEQVVLALAWRKGSGHSLEVTVPAGLTVQADPSQLYRTLVNLVDNALKYSPAGGLVRIGGRELDGSVEISVSDEGIGILPIEQQRLFERFHRATDVAASESFGLGLYTCKRIVEAHGGSISVESEYGRGSTFAVCLPATSHISAALSLVS